MKKLFAALLMFAVAAPMCARAEGSDGPPGAPGEHKRMSVDEHMTHLTKQLNLTPDQQTKVRAIITETKSRMEDLSSQMKALHEKTDQDISAVLTGDQKKKFEEMKERRKQHRDEMREKRRDDKKETK